MIDFGFGVKLGKIERSELPSLRAWRNKRQIWKHCRQYDLIDEISQEAWYERIWKDPSISMYTIVNKKSSVGVCGFTDIDKHNQRAEFSLYVAPEYQGAGLGSAGLSTLFSHGFYNHNFNVIWGESFASNPARKVFLKLGMKEEGCRRDFYFRDGVFEDCYIYSLLRREWSP